MNTQERVQRNRFKSRLKSRLDQERRNRTAQPVQVLKQNSDKKHILILTADAGFGHRSASQAIAEAIEARYGDQAVCRIVNPVDDPRAPLVLRKTQDDYDSTVLNHPYLYRLSYAASDSLPVGAAVEGVVSVSMQRVFRSLLRQQPYDVIISTYLIYNLAIRSALRASHLNIPFFSVITDLRDVHSLWLEPGPDKFFVPSEDVRQQAILNHIAPEKIIVSGLPVNPRIADETRSKAEIRRSLGWDPQLPTVLAVGSRRVSELIDHLDGVDSLGIPLHLVLVAGGDDELYQKMLARTWQVPTHIYNLVSDMPAMLHAADVLISKAGGLITSEALACGLPMILVDFIPGRKLAI